MDRNVQVKLHVFNDALAACGRHSDANVPLANGAHIVQCNVAHNIGVS